MTNFGHALRDKLEELAMPADWEYFRNFPIYPLPIEGCSEDEITEIQRKQSATYLPEIYVEFLRYLGKSPGDIYLGFDLHYKYLSIYNFREGLNYSLSLFGFSALGSDVYAFMSRQGYAYWFFYTTSRNDDPPIYLFSEALVEKDGICKEGPIIESEHLSLFLTSFIAERRSKEEQMKFLAEHLPHLYQLSE